VFAYAEGDLHFVWFEVEKVKVVFEGDINGVSQVVFVYGLDKLLLAAEDVSVPDTFF